MWFKDYVVIWKGNLDTFQNNILESHNLQKLLKKVCKNTEDILRFLWANSFEISRTNRIVLFISSENFPMGLRENKTFSHGSKTSINKHYKMFYCKII